MARKITTAFFLISMLFLHLGESWHIPEPESELCSCNDEAPPPPPSSADVPPPPPSNLNKAPPPPPATTVAPPPPSDTTEAPPPPTSTPGDGTTEGSLKPQDCNPHCQYRCSKTKHRMHTCMFFCLKCCAKCLCVPAGTYGNKQTCPCYDNWKTKKGGPKCP